MNTNDDLVAYEMQKAREAIIEAEFLINNKMWNAAVNRN
jgi:hypothetical protein